MTLSSICLNMSGQVYVKPHTILSLALCICSSNTFLLKALDGDWQPLQTSRKLLDKALIQLYGTILLPSDVIRDRTR